MKKTAANLLKESKRAVSKVLEMAPRTKSGSAPRTLKVKDLVDAVTNGNVTDHFNFNDYIGNKNPDNYDGSYAEIIYWHLTLPGNVKWTFSVCEDELPESEIAEELAKIPKAVLNKPLKGMYASEIIDITGVISEPGWLTQRQIWKKIWE